MKKFGWIFFIFMLFPGTSTAEIEIHYYRDYQDQAPEHITIVPLKVRKEWCVFCPERDISVKAKVTAVSRSESNLKIGDVIVIRYRLFRPPKKWVGPRPIPLLKKKHPYPAFLKREKGIYVPAARGYSFGPILVGA